MNLIYKKNYFIFFLLILLLIFTFSNFSYAFFGIVALIPLLGNGIVLLFIVAISILGFLIYPLKKILDQLKKKKKKKYNSQK